MDAEEIEIKDIDDRGMTTITTKKQKDLYNVIATSKKYKNRYLKHSYRAIKSKKNAVAYVILDGKPRILKWFAPGFTRQMDVEYSTLKKGSSALNIPISYEKDSDNNVLIINYIMGENLCDVLNDEKTVFSENQRIMVLLADWFARFHKSFKTADQFYIRGDSILRNFILADCIWGVDFEESRVGKPVEDIAGMCSSILSTDPMFTSEKFQLCKTFIASYAESVKWNLENINEEVAYALLEKIQWRPEVEETLRNHAHKIRKHGLLR